MVRPGRLLTLALVSFLVAGCVQSAAKPDAAAQPSLGAVSDDTGAVQGTVTSEELAPIAGAVVGISGGAQTTTDASGHFVLGSLPPGDITLAAAALGFASTVQRVTIVAGQTATANFQLTKEAVKVPYHELYILKGYSTCDIALFLEVTTIDSLTGSCPIGTPKRSVIHDVPETWKYGVVEMDWATNDAFALYINKDINCQTGDPCYGIKFGGHAPLRLDMAPGDKDLAAKWASDKKATYPEGKWQMWANVLYIGMYRDQWGSVTDDPVCRQALNYSPGCPSWGVSTGIEFSEYVTLFHYERPEHPEQYSGLPDK